MQIGLSNCLNYTGSKFRYLADLAEVLPQGENLTVCDPFVGGGDLCCHLPESWKVEASDSSDLLIAMHLMFQNYGKYAVERLLAMIKNRGLSKTNEQAYYDLRDLYNRSDYVNPFDLYALICHSNTNRMRFNSKGEFNMPFGKRTFNDSMHKKALDYVDRLSKRDIEFSSKNYTDIDFNKFDLGVFDPPYLNTIATYNENGAWKLENELHLQEKIKAECNKFVYFGQVYSKGVHNEALEQFASDYNTKVLKDTTASCSSNRKKEGKTIEIMIWN